MKIIDFKDYGVNNITQVFLLDQMTGADGDLFAYWFSWCNADFLTTTQDMEMLVLRMNTDQTYPGSGFAPKLMKDDKTNYDAIVRVLNDLPKEQKEKATFVLTVTHPGARVHEYFEDGIKKMRPITEFGSTYNALDDFPIKTHRLFKISLLFSNIESFLYTVCWFHNHYHHQDADLDAKKYNAMLERITGYYGSTASNIINSKNFDNDFIAIDHIDLLLNEKYNELKALIELLSSNNHDTERYEFLYQHWRENRLNNYIKWRTDFISSQPEHYKQLKQQLENNLEYQNVLKRLKVINAKTIDKYLKTHYNV